MPKIKSNSNLYSSDELEADLKQALQRALGSAAKTNTILGIGELEPADPGDFVELLEAIPAAVGYSQLDSGLVFSHLLNLVDCCCTRMGNELAREAGLPEWDRLLNELWTFLLDTERLERTHGQKWSAKLNVSKFTAFAAQIGLLSGIAWSAPQQIYDLTKKFRVSDDTIRNWASGKTRLPPTLKAMKKISTGVYKYMPAYRGAV